MMLALASPDKLTRVIESDSAEASPSVNANGQLFAYTSNSSGRTEVYVSPIDGSTRRQVSFNGGTSPRWSRSGRELFFAVTGQLTDSDTLYAALVRGSGQDISVESIRPVLTGTNLRGGYGIMPGDTSFVMRAVATDDRRNLPPIFIVQNFVDELRRLFKTGGGASQ